MGKLENYKKDFYQILKHPLFIIITIYILCLVTHNKVFFKITSENWGKPFLWYWFFAISIYIFVFAPIFKKFGLDND